VVKEVDDEKQAPSPFMADVGQRLRKLRVSLDMSPEAVSEATGGAVTGSYIRRIEKGLNAPTIETLDRLLRAMGSNIGLFFEYQVDDSAELPAQDRRFRNIVQRGLSGAQRDDIISMIRIIERSL
jgi:transcriptional regulator with XRE-family HTH domain